MEALAKGLHPLEIRLLLGFGPEEDIDGREAARRLGFNQGQCNQAFSWLVAKGFIEERGRRSESLAELTELGRTYKAKGTPAERLVAQVAAGPAGPGGPRTLPELAAALGLEASDVGSAFGALAKEGVLALDAEKRVVPAGTGSRNNERVRALLARFPEEGAVPAAALGDEWALVTSMSRKRGSSAAPFRVMEREEVIYRLTAEGARAKEALRDRGASGEQIGVLTPEILQDGSWRARGFRPYSVGGTRQRPLIGRRNPYVEFLERLKDKLVSLGFEEFDGPLVETEFWNSDALFMPQFHSARDIHDVFYIKDPTHRREIEQPYLDRVAAAHENGWETGSRGWGYRFDRDFTRRLILRSQGTVLSARQLHNARVPGKYFGCVRCFRPDDVDAHHAADFYQTEGIVLGQDVNLKTLLGLLKIFAEEVAGAREIKFAPAYFPFTEPSVEVHMKHPRLGWMELGGSGIFRPEVTKPMGVDVPVLAWGLGIDRMAMVSMGINDIRDLFTPDLESVRLRTRR
jgi:phenylalanyl-tRNA synthetase alpha chain